MTTNVDEAGGLDLEEARKALAAADPADRVEFKERTKDMKRVSPHRYCFYIQ